MILTRIAIAIFQTLDVLVVSGELEELRLLSKRCYDTTFSKKEGCVSACVTLYYF
ncbi:hypothetical protein [Nostoc punctiforme]|uniref:hypothetical protein n=1 Tax=Nostoc punctiforme TaxID=272131 RepID=UPI001427D57E|nr:hypothetical protein [Nostoc punctiforme]